MSSHRKRSHHSSRHKNTRDSPSERSERSSCTPPKQRRVSDEISDLVLVVNELKDSLKTTNNRLSEMENRFTVFPPKTLDTVQHDDALSTMADDEGLGDNDTPPEEALLPTVEAIRPTFTAKKIRYSRQPNFRPQIHQQRSCTTQNLLYPHGNQVQH